MPLTLGCQLIQTDCPAPLFACCGSPGSSVAPELLPQPEPDEPARLTMEPNASVNWSVAFVTRTTATSLSVAPRSEEHTSELQSQSNLVCRLLLEKKKKKKKKKKQKET